MKLSDLVELTSRGLNLSNVEVGNLARSLREAGLLTKGGKGGAAADIVTADVARLIIATLVRDRRSQAAAIVNDWWGLHLVSKTPEHLLETLPKRIRQAAKTPACTFGEAFTALIDDCVSGEMEVYLESPKSWGKRFGLKIVSQFMDAELGLAPDDRGEDSPNKVNLVFKGALDSDAPREFLTIHSLTIRPIMAIAKAMRESAT